MKKSILAAALLAAAAVPAHADVVDYVELFGGVTQSPDLGSPPPAEFEMEPGYNVGGAFGWNFEQCFSAELEFFFTDADFEGFDNSVESFTDMVNGFYHFQDVGYSLRPYIGAGAGFAQVKFSDESLSVSDTDTVFAYQAMLGILHKVEENVDLIVEYRYQGANDANLDIGFGPFDQEYESHSLSAGFRFNL